jgi:Protein of unknown function (DUF3486)
MPKARRKTGERPQVRQPLKIDQLPQAIRDRILEELNKNGRTYAEIEFDSPNWEQWKKCDDRQVALFPGKRLPHSNIQRWYDLRVRQVQDDILRTSEQARQVAKVFALAAIADDDEAILNAARDTAFSILRDTKPNDRMKILQGLIKLGKVRIDMRKIKTVGEKTVAIEERRVSALERKLTMVKDAAGNLKEQIARKTMTPEQLQESLDQIYGIAG